MSDTNDAMISIIDSLDVPVTALALTLRSRPHFNCLSQAFTKMDEITNEFFADKRKQVRGSFLKYLYKTEQMGTIWSTISFLYDKGHLPLNIKQIRGESEEDLIRRVKKTTSKIVSSLTVDGELHADIENFFIQSSDRYLDDVESDFEFAFNRFRTASMYIADQVSPIDLYLQANHQQFEAIDRRITRTFEVKRLFGLLDIDSIQGGDISLLDSWLNEVDTPLIPTYSGNGLGTFDDELTGIGGFPHTGLVMICAGTGGGKTLFKSSLVANHCFNALINNEEPPVIWGYIGEDSTHSYLKRVSINIINRIRDSDKKPRIDGSHLKKLLLSRDQETIDLIKTIQDRCFSRTNWKKGAASIASSLTYTVADLINSWSENIKQEGVTPKFIIIDYFNLLTLPKTNSLGNVATDLSKIAHILDEWAEMHGTAIISSIQASSTGNVKARDDMRFLELEDLSESKNAANSCRLVLSLLSVDMADGTSVLGFKVLKNRAGPNNYIYISDLDKTCNVTMTSTKRVSSTEWAEFADKVKADKNPQVVEVLAQKKYKINQTTKPGPARTKLFSKSVINKPKALKTSDPHEALIAKNRHKEGV